MKSWFGFLPLLFALSAAAQPGPDTLWTRTYGWSGNDTAFSLQSTPDGGFILVGTATIPAAPSHTDMFAVKTNGLGEMQAFRSYGGPGNQGGHAVSLARDGGYMFGGFNTWTNGYTLAWFVRTNSVGDTLGSGVQSFNEDHNTTCWSLVQDVALNYFASGVYDDSPTGHDDCRSMIWVDSMGQTAGGGGLETYHVTARGICTTRDSMVALVGQQVDSANGPHLAYLWKTGGGDYWFRTYGGGAYEDEAYDVIATTDGFVMAGVTTDGHDDGIFLCKTNFHGDLMWLRRMVGEFAGTAFAMTPCIGGGFVVAGMCPTYWYGTDMFLAKFDNDGDLVWRSGYGGNGNEWAYDVVQTADGGFVLCGYTDSQGAGGTDWYIVKTAPDPSLSVSPGTKLLPNAVSLMTYPNPFNPVTTIAFVLPARGRTTIVVSDILGREIQTLWNDLSDAGEHHVGFDGSSLPSGLYFARLQSGSFTATQKLLLLK